MKAYSAITAFRVLKDPPSFFLYPCPRDALQPFLWTSHLNPAIRGQESRLADRQREPRRDLMSIARIEMHVIRDGDNRP